MSTAGTGTAGLQATRTRMSTAAASSSGGPGRADREICPAGIPSPPSYRQRLAQVPRTARLAACGRAADELGPGIDRYDEPAADD